jgi:acyl carrier protein
VPGELLLGGVGLARGFLGRPELTAEHFIAVPFAHGGLQRVYRTGDLVRRLADGRLEYLGRKDSQLKIRGFRIEPGEIESTLREHPGVADAVAAAHADPAGDGRLVAYFVRSEKSACTASELRAFLKSRLPGHMVPAFLLELDAFPRTPNGKVDRKRLPAPGHLHHVSAHVAPRNELEAEMASLWESVLGIKGIGVQDNFFDLGGHSLLAMTLLQRVRDAFQLDLTPRMLFDHATVAELVECMQQVQVRSPRASAPAWTSEAREAGSL